MGQGLRVMNEEKAERIRAVLAGAYEEIDTILSE